MPSRAARLRELREQARPPITVRALAERLGLSHTGYHRYESENGYKQRFLPMDLARRIAAVLADRGVNPDDVLALAGIGVDEASTPALSAGEEQLVDRFRQMEPERRRLLLEIADAFLPGAPIGASLHGRRHPFTPQPQGAG